MNDSRTIISYYRMAFLFLFQMAQEKMNLYLSLPIYSLIFTKKYNEQSIITVCHILISALENYNEQHFN